MSASDMYDTQGQSQGFSQFSPFRDTPKVPGAVQPEKPQDGQVVGTPNVPTDPTLSGWRNPQQSNARQLGAPHERMGITDGSASSLQQAIMGGMGGTATGGIGNAAPPGLGGVYNDMPIKGPGGMVSSTGGVNGQTQAPWMTPPPVNTGDVFGGVPVNPLPQMYGGGVTGMGPGGGGVSQPQHQTLGGDNTGINGKQLANGTPLDISGGGYTGLAPQSTASNPFGITDPGQGPNKIPSTTPQPFSGNPQADWQQFLAQNPSLGGSYMRTHMPEVVSQFNTQFGGHATPGNPNAKGTADVVNFPGVGNVDVLHGGDDAAQWLVENGQQGPGMLAQSMGANVDTSNPLIAAIMKQLQARKSTNNG